MHSVYLLAVAMIATATAEEEEDTFASGIAADVGTLVIAVVAVALLLFGLCVFVAAMRYRRGGGDSIGPVSVTEI